MHVSAEKVRNGLLEAVSVVAHTLFCRGSRRRKLTYRMKTPVLYKRAAEKLTGCRRAASLLWCEDAPASGKQRFIPLLFVTVILIFFVTAQ